MSTYCFFFQRVGRVYVPYQNRIDQQTKRQGRLKLFQTMKERRKPKLEHGLMLAPYGETAKKLLLTGGNIVRNAWQQVPAGNAWLNWLVLLFLGVTAVLTLTEEDLPWTHGFKKHHHRTMTMINR